MRAARPVVDHLVRVPMVGRHEHRSRPVADHLDEAAEATIDRLDRLDRRLDHPRVPYHVGVGVVQDEEPVGRIAEPAHRFVGQLPRAHLGLQVVGRDLGRRHQRALLTWKWDLLAAVEEIRDVRVLLGLRHPQLANSLPAHHLPDGVAQGGVLEEHGVREGLVVGGHADQIGIERPAGPRERVEIGVRERPDDLPHAVRAEIEHEDRVPSGDRAVLPRGLDHRRLDELIVLAAGVGHLQRLDRALRLEPFPRRDRPVGFLGPVPSLVPVHREVATGQGGEASATQRSEYRLGRLEIRLLRARRHVPAVRDGVHADPLDTRLGGDPEKRVQVPKMAVHASRRMKSDEMEGPAALQGPGQRVAEDGIPLQGSVLDGAVDLREVLIDDPPGAEVEMADLGVSHLSRGEPDRFPPRDERRVRAVAHQGIHDGRARHRHGVSVRAWIQAPPVQDDQSGEWNRRGRHAAKGSTGQCSGPSAGLRAVISSGRSPLAAPSVPASPRR